MAVEFCQMFLASVDMIMRVNFRLLIWFIKLIDFQILKQLCIPGLNSAWKLCINLFMYCWIWLANYSRFLHLLFMRDTGSQCSFLELSPIWFWYWYIFLEGHLSIVTSLKNVCVPLLRIYLKEIEILITHRLCVQIVLDLNINAPPH